MGAAAAPLFIYLHMRAVYHNKRDSHRDDTTRRFFVSHETTIYILLFALVASNLIPLLLAVSIFHLKYFYQKLFWDLKFEILFINFLHAQIVIFHLDEIIGFQCR